MKSIYSKFIANSFINEKKPRAFSLKSGNRTRKFTLFIPTVDKT